jgi:diguanylate cyclase (GGDEF)-like protein
LSVQGPYRWRLGRITLIASAILTLAFALGAVSLYREAGRIRELAEDTRSHVVPQLLERDHAVVNIERLKQYGATILDSTDPRTRSDMLVLVAHLAKHPALQSDSSLHALVHEAETAAAHLATARDQGDALRSKGQAAAADEAERAARQEWREVNMALDNLSESLLVGVGDTGARRAEAFNQAAHHVQVMVLASYTFLLLALLGAGLLVHQLLLKPILLTTESLDRSEDTHAVILPSSKIREIDLFYRSVERMATALSEIEEAHRQARSAQADLRRLASIDELTGVANRRWFTAMASRELERCRRFNHQLALLMIDVDHFKRVNDTHGHAVGDEVLKAFTRVLEGNLRSVDLLGRLGGEEFAVVLPEADQDAATHTAERLRLAVEALQFPFEDGSVLRITTSVGIATMALTGESLDSLLARADSALYAAKHQGRNRVVIN